MVALQYQNYTVEEFLGLDLPEGQEFELINGIITPMAEPSGAHENLRSGLLVELSLESRSNNLGLLLHPKPVLELGPRDTRKPDLIAVNRESWKAQTAIEAVLKQAPEIVIEIVSTNWEADYFNKPAWYAAFGVQEFWIIDPLFTVERYPTRRNPKITQPTVSVGRLVPSRSIIVEQEYVFDSHTGSDRIQSKFFPDLNLTVEQIIALGTGL